MKKARILATGMMVAMLASSIATAGGSSGFPPEKPSAVSFWSWLFG